MRALFSKFDTDVTLCHISPPKMGEGVKNDGIANNNRVAARFFAGPFARGFGHGTTTAAVRPKKGRVREKDEVGRGGGEGPKAPANMAN